MPLGERFIRPAGGSASFAALPGTVEHALTGTGRPIPALARRHDRVVLVLVDAFGWRFFERHAAHPLLRRFADDGVVVRLSSQFPSTTAAHLTTLYTGAPVGVTGTYEWFMYEPGLDRIIAPLLFSYAGDGTRETLLLDGVSPAALFPFETVAERLAAAGVESFAFQDAAFTPSPYSAAMFRGATLRGERSFDAMLGGVAAAVSTRTPSYGLVYDGSVDMAGHVHGPSSTQFATRIQAVLTAIDERLLPRLAQLGGSTLLLLTADHGQVDIDPAATIRVNRAWPGILQHLRAGRDGRPLAPAGSTRDLFLHVRDGSVETVCDHLRRVLDGRAEVHPAADLIAAGLFGDVTPRLLERVGNVVVVPYAGETTWWDDPRFEVGWRGGHGGLSPDEAETYVAALSI